MNMPLSLNELVLWLGVTSIILSLTSEFLNLIYDDLNLVIEIRKLNNITDIVGVSFVVVFIIIILIEVIN